MHSYMRKLRQLFLLTSLFSLLLGAAPGWAKEGDQIREKLTSIGIGVSEVASSDIDGLLEVHTSQGVLFATPDGKYFIAGTLYQLGNDGKVTNVMAARQAPLNAKALAKYRDQMIEYKADNEKYAVTVFTDTTCGYCVKLHSQMADYNALGITVRYLAFPRQGPTGSVAKQMAQIWCSDDQKQALNDAKLKQKSTAVDGSRCEPMIARHHQLGRELGISGTPAIFLPDGTMVGGYVPPKTLLEQLENL